MFPGVMVSVCLQTYEDNPALFTLFTDFLYIHKHTPATRIDFLTDSNLQYQKIWGQYVIYLIKINTSGKHDQ